MIQSSVSFMFWKGVHDLFLTLTLTSAQSLAQSRIFPTHRPLPYLHVNINITAEQTNSLETFRNKVHVRRNEGSSLNGDDYDDQEDLRSDERSNDIKMKEVDENENTAYN